MAEVDIDPFGKHKTDKQPDVGEPVPFAPPVVIKTPSWEPEQETSFGRTSQRTEVLREHVKPLYHVLSEETGQTPEAFHFNDFELRDGKLYYRDKSTSLTIRGGKLRLVGEIVKTLGKQGLRESGFDIHRGKVTAGQALVWNGVELPFCLT